MEANQFILMVIVHCVKSCLSDYFYSCFHLNDILQRKRQNKGKIQENDLNNRVLFSL